MSSASTEASNPTTETSASSACSASDPTLDSSDTVGTDTDTVADSTNPKTKAAVSVPVPDGPVEGTVAGTDFFLFHSPYNKLVQKSFARLVYSDLNQRHLDLNQQKEGQGQGQGQGQGTGIGPRTGYGQGQGQGGVYALPLPIGVDSSAVNEWMGVPTEQTFGDKKLEKALKAVAIDSPLYREKVAPACVASKLIGNTYTAAVWLNLANLVSTYGEDLQGRSITLFSYGSGAIATMLKIDPVDTSVLANFTSSKFNLKKMQVSLLIEI